MDLLASSSNRLVSQRRAAGLMVAVAFTSLVAGCHWFLTPADRIERASSAIANGNDRAAVIELQNALQSEPGNGEARMLLAETSLRMGDVRATENELELVEKSGATGARITDLKLQLRLAQGAHERLLEELATGTIAVEEPRRTAYKGHALRGLNRNEDAVQMFESVLASYPQDSDARLGLGEALAATGQTDRGLEQMDLVLRADPKNAKASMLKGSLLARRGDYREAAQVLADARQNAAGQLTVAQYQRLLAILVEANVAASALPEARAVHAEIAKLAPDAPLTRLLSARIAMSAQDYSTAVAEAQRAVTAAPTLSQAKLLLGAALLAQGNVNQAERHLAELVQSSPENIEARKLLAQANLRLQRPDIAAQVLMPMQDSADADAQLSGLLGLVNLQQGNQAEAVALLEKSVVAQPENSQLKLDLAAAYVRSGQSEKAVDLLRSMPERNATRRDAMLVAAVAAAKGEAAAVAEIDRIAVKNLANLAAVPAVAALYSRYGHPERARELLQRALSVEPKNVSVLAALARLEATLRDLPAARGALDKALAVSPNDAALLTARGEIALQERDGATAITMLTQARKQSPNSIAPRLLLARAYFSVRRTTEADQVIAEALRETDPSGRVNAEVGRVFLDAGHYEKALAAFRDAARLAPHEPDHQLSIARAQFALGNFVEAKQAAQKALELRPNSVAATSVAVLIDLREGQIDVASRRLEALKRQRPNDAAVAMLEGDVALASKAYEAAARAYAAASRLSPSSAAAIREYRARSLGGLPRPEVPLQSWLQQRPQDEATRLVLAEAYTSARDIPKAINEYELLMRNGSPGAMTLNNLAWLYSESGDPRALELAKRAYDASTPKMAAISDTYGWILVRSGRVQDAVPILKSAAEEPSADPDIRYHYAYALAKSGRPEDARRELTQLVGRAKGYASEAAAAKLLQELGG